jgi:hypothetical protein
MAYPTGSPPLLQTTPAKNSRQAEHDEAGDGDNNSDRGGSSPHIHSFVFVTFMASDRVALGTADEPAA